MINIKCYLSKENDKLVLRDKETNLPIINPVLTKEAEEAYTVFIYYCTFFDELSDRNDTKNYIEFIGPNKKVEDGKIIMTNGPIGPIQYVPVRYKLELKDMSYDEEVDLSKPADLDFILSNLYDVIKHIERIEKNKNIVLVGDRSSIKVPIISYNDIDRTYTEVLDMVHDWREKLVDKFKVQ